MPTEMWEVGISCAIQLYFRGSNVFRNLNASIFVNRVARKSPYFLEVNGFCCGKEIIATFGWMFRNLDSQPNRRFALLDNTIELDTNPRYRDAPVGHTWQNDAFFNGVLIRYG